MLVVESMSILRRGKKRKIVEKTGRLAKVEGKGNRVYKRKGLRGSEGHKNETVRKIRYG